jgi:hypothetical protein
VPDVGCVQRNEHTQTIRTVQRPNDFERKSYGGTTETFCRQQAEKESRQLAKQSRQQAGETPTRARPLRVVYPSIRQRKVSTCSVHA